jgi:hypothetical protein
MSSVEWLTGRFVNNQKGEPVQMFILCLIFRQGFKFYENAWLRGRQSVFSTELSTASVDLLEVETIMTVI